MPIPHFAHVTPDTKTLTVEPEQTLLKAALDQGIPLIHACGGSARCSTCRIQITSGLEHCLPRTDAEQRIASRLHFAPEIRLACQTRIKSDVAFRRLAIDSRDKELMSVSEDGVAIEPIGEEMRIAILFSDIRGFTTFSERLPPYDVIHVLNRHFHEMQKPIEAQSGYINNFMGDGLMALFGADGQPEAALRAVKAGLGMLEALENFKPYLLSLYGTAFQIGIGIHIGEAVVGTIGTVGTIGSTAGQSKHITAIGDSVNFASRIESETRRAGTDLLISDCVYKETHEQLCTGKTISVNLKGKSGLYTLHEVLGLVEKRINF